MTGVPPTRLMATVRALKAWLGGSLFLAAACSAVGAAEISPDGFDSASLSAAATHDDSGSIISRCDG